jgi:hypothetical protein
MYDSTMKELFFPLHYSIIFKGQGTFKAIDLQSGITECRMYHNAILESDSQS